MKNYYRAIVTRLEKKGLLRWMPDELYLKLVYRARVGKKLNLKNPKRFNEKLQWLKLYDRNPLYTTMVDKYKVKSYVSNIIGPEHVIPTIGVWNSPEEVEFDKLPDQFVLKCNHDSGGLVICKDKDKLDVKKAKEKLNKAFKKNGYSFGREWPYKNVQKRILCEKYMEDESGYELKDYKVLCFNGEPKLVQIHRGRFNRHTQDYYDVNWNHLEYTQGCPLSEVAMERPVFLDEMLSLSRKLSKGIPHVRVDWYYVDGTLYFGEMTFFDASGYDDFEPDEVNNIVGDWITLPN